MPIRGGYDVQLGDYPFRLALDQENPYVHYYVPVSAGRREVAGEPDKESLLSDEIVWSYTDWSGGEGARVWYPDDPTVYHYAEPLNPRIPGQLTGRPTRTQVSVTVTDATRRPAFALGQGRLWVGCHQTLRYSTDQGATWSDATNALNLAGLGSAWKITAMVGDHSGVYIAATNGSSRVLRKVYISVGSPTGVDVVASHAASNPWVGLALMGGRLYGWTGRKLWEFDVASTLPLVLNNSYRKVYDTGADVDWADYGGSQPGSWWADIANAENSVVMFTAMEGQTILYEYDGIAGRPLWDPMPFGLTAKSMKVQNGIVYIAGHWSGESVPTGGHGALYALPLDNPVPLFLAWFRKDELGANLQMQEMANSYGSQIMVAAAKQGRIFIYDADYDAVSLLDDLQLGSTFKIGDMITVGQKRLVAVYEPQAPGTPTSITIYRYTTDEPADRETQGSQSASLYMGRYDGGMPHELKVLHGFHVTFAPLAPNQRIHVYYDPDESGTWALAGTITSASQGAADGRVWLQVSTPEPFYGIRVRVTLDNNGISGVALPILYGISPVARPSRREEWWDLKLRLYDEHQQRGRGAARAVPAERLRDWLLSMAASGQVVTFLDGARYALRPNAYTTHKVSVEEVRDVILRPGGRPDASAEGYCFVRLKAVPA